MSFQAKLIPGFFASNMQVDNFEEAIRGIAESAQSLGLVKRTWLDALLLREKEFPTGLPTTIPVAIPHTDSAHVNVDGFGFFRLVKPVEFGEMGSIDGLVSVSMVFPLLITDPKNQVELLTSVIERLQAPGLLEELMEAETDELVMKILGS